MPERLRAIFGLSWNAVTRGWRSFSVIALLLTALILVACPVALAEPVSPTYCYLCAGSKDGQVGVAKAAFANLWALPVDDGGWLQNPPRSGRLLPDPGAVLASVNLWGDCFSRAPPAL